MGTEVTERGYDLKRLLVGTGITQSDVAGVLGKTEAQVSRILNERDAMPEDFPARFRLAMHEIHGQRGERLAEVA